MRPTVLRPFGLEYYPSTPPGTATGGVQVSKKTQRDRAKAEHPLRALREACAAVGSRPAARDTEDLMNARLRAASGRKSG